MPLYEYECPVCDAVKLITRPVADRNDPVVCTEGGHSKTQETLMRRGISSGGFVLKGSNWAKDGYAG